MHPTLNEVSVLCYGHDAMLLMTRQRLLESLGLQVTIVYTSAEFQAKLQAIEPALILLCQSLSIDERISAGALAHEKSPLSKILIMHPGRGDYRLRQDQSEFFSLDGPESFLDTVNRIIDSATADLMAGGAGVRSCKCLAADRSSRRHACIVGSYSRICCSAIFLG